jgi:hypothetical protein
VDHNLLETCSATVTQRRQKHSSTTPVCYIGVVGKNKVCEHCSCIGSMAKRTRVNIIQPILNTQIMDLPVDYPAWKHKSLRASILS